VALQLAADHPSAVAGVLLVGAAADPGREKTHPLQRVAAIGAISWVLPRPLAHSNAELLALPAELAALGNKMESIRAPVTVLHGLHDTLVPPENASWLIDRLVGAARKRLLFVEGAGHFLHILASELVESALARVLADADLRPGRLAAPTG
jgi:pimeloyl-ACP methyl ester carboxylesterase